MRVFWPKHSCDLVPRPIGDMLHAGIPWVADGYQTSASESSHHKTMAMMECLESSRSGVLSSDAQLMLGLRPSTPVKRQRQRVRSATIVKLQEREALKSTKTDCSENKPPPYYSGFRGKRPSSSHVGNRVKVQMSQRRPASAMATFKSPKPASARPCGAHGRPMSAPAYRALTPQTNNSQRPCTAHVWGALVPSAAPDHRYLDRHARCLGHNHIHADLLKGRPQMACENCGILCPNNDVCHKMDRSSIIAEKEANLRADRHWKYVNSMRPRTAPPSGRVSSIQSPIPKLAEGKILFTIALLVGVLTQNNCLQMLCRYYCNIL